MDAMSLLKEDHQKVKKMLAELESTTERGVKTREELFTRLKQELVVHEAIEEEIFYPALKDHPKTKEIAKAIPRNFSRFWLMAGKGVAGGSMTLTTFISPVSRTLDAASFSWINAARRRFVSTSEASRRYSSSSFDSPDRSRRRALA
jgi:hypothetical protein